MPLKWRSTFYQCFSKKGREKVKVVILGAGQGKRLLPLTEDVPKALLDIGGRRLIEWQIEAFSEAGVDEFAVVTGNKADLMADFLEGVAADKPGISIRTVYNPFYSVADNLASCWMARHEMDQEFILVNGDNMFRAGMVKELLGAPPAPVTVAIGHKDSYDTDDMKVMVDGDRLTEIGKTLPLEAVDAESIGMILFRGEGPKLYRDTLERSMAEPAGLRQWHLSVINTLAKEEDVRVRSVDEHEWCEVDFPVDLQHARHLVATWT